jgi:hypothetical protein
MQVRRTARAHAALAVTLSVALAWAASCGSSDDPAAAGASGAGASAGVGPGAGGGDPVEPEPCEKTDSCAEFRSWCDPATWGGAVPDADTDVVIPDGIVVVDCDAEARTVTIEAAGTLRAGRSKRNTLTMHGNLVVLGTLDYGTPDDRVGDGTTAEIVFQGMDDEAYLGTPDAPPVDKHTPVDTPMAVVASDVGLWVMQSGRFLAAGAPKKAWSKLVDGAGPGDATFEVEDASGWRAGDRVALTPTATLAETDPFAQLDEGVVESVEGNVITLQQPPAFEHLGCDGCTRRGEAANLTRNVVVRSFDDTAHAHVLAADKGLIQIDSVELRWLGPARACSGGEPSRRAPLYFHQQRWDADASFVRHASIWGGENHFLMLEMSHGVEVVDVAGYDTYGTGFALFYDNSACGTFCQDDEERPSQGTVFDQVLAAFVGIHERVEGCLTISHRHSGFIVSGGEGSGCRGCVATGVGHNGSGADVSGFEWAEGGSGRPLDFTFDDSVAHDNKGHGAFIWHNGGNSQEPYENNAFWSNTDYGIHWGAYGNAYVLQTFEASDNGFASVGIKAVPADDRARLDGATVDDLQVLSYVSVQQRVNLLRDLTFSGDRPIGVSQVHEACDQGDPDDPADPDCVRVWLRFENPKFPAGVTPFDFGQTFNKHSVWEVRGFQSVDYPDLPADFDLYRADNEVPGGSYHADFDAWLVPK